MASFTTTGGHVALHTGNGLSRAHKLLYVHAKGLSRLVENEAKRLVEGALAVAKDIVQANIKVWFYTRLASMHGLGMCMHVVSSDVSICQRCKCVPASVCGSKASRAWRASALAAGG